MRYRLVINPESDEDFSLRVHHAAHPSMLDPGELEAELRRTYPETVVRAGVAESDGRRRWYVYRDGRWVQAHQEV
jgi:hypothetical protein